MTTEHLRGQLRAAVRSAYDMQKLRIAAGLRLCANFRHQIGQEAGVVEEDLDDAAKDLLVELRETYRRLTDGIAKNRELPKKAGFTGDGLITDYATLMVVDSYFRMDKVEKTMFKHLELMLEEFPIYNEFLSGVKGIGPAMAAVIIAEIDIHAAAYPSSLHKYAGLDTGPDGLGRSKRREHLVKRTYTDRDGKEQERDSITYNPFLKTKLMGVVASSFLRSKSPYAQVYADYKHRLQSDPGRIKMSPEAAAAAKEAGLNPFNVLWRPKRIHDASQRYMIKMFLIDLYRAWRPLEGLAVAPTYQEAKLGHVHGAGRAA